MTTPASDLCAHRTLIGESGGPLSAAAEGMDRLKDKRRDGLDMSVDVPAVLARLRTGDAPPEFYRALVGCTIAEVERALILATLNYCRGNRTTAAGILGISVRTMRNKLRSFMEDGVAVIPATHM